MIFSIELTNTSCLSLDSLENKAGKALLTRDGYFLRILPSVSEAA